MVLAPERMTGVSGRRWQLCGRSPETDRDIADAPFEGLIRHLLWHRGIRTTPEAVAFMEAPDPKYDPWLLPDIRPALDRLQRTVNSGEQVAVYGDFDVDGITASVILVEALQDLGGNVRSYIPNRFAEGYGVNMQAVEALAADGVSLIITADCGTGSVAEIERARDLGVDVIVIDHHTVPPDLPPTAALVNPKRPDANYPEPELSSGGLAYRIMELLYSEARRQWDPDRYLDLAALSTVCDMAPIRGENRWIVREGLSALSRTKRPGLLALFETTGTDPALVGADTIGYTIGPRLNAAGRLADASLARDLLMERDADRAREIALELSRLNQERQAETQRSLDLARSLLQDEDTSGPLLFVGHEDIPPGIVGLIAGRLTEEYNRPSAVFCLGETESRASCRSIDEFDITAALRQCKDILVRFGGHRAAAGFTVRNENLPALKQRLIDIAAMQLGGLDLQPSIEIDAAIPLAKVNGKLIRTLSSLAPFGVSNPEPVFLSREVEVADVKVMGSDGTHLRLVLKDGRSRWAAVAFGKAHHEVEIGQRLDVVYTFSADNRDGAIELRLEDFAPSA